LLTAFQLLVMRRASIVLGEDYGAFAWLYAVASLALAFTLIGLHATLMRYLAIYTKQRAQRAALRVLLRCAALRTVLVAIVASGLWCYLRSRGGAMSLSVTTSVCAFFAMQGLMLLGHAALQGLGRYNALAAASLCLFLGLLTPATDLASLFQTLWIGYGCSMVFIAGVLAVHFREARRDTATIPGEVDLPRVAAFSFVLSIAGVCVLASDTSPVLLTQSYYAPAVYSGLALAFNLALYPARINAFSEAFAVPRFSAALADGTGPAAERFVAWSRLLHLGSLLVMLPVVVLIGPAIRVFFAPELAPAIFLASLLMLANLARMLVPLHMSVLVAAGRPGRFAACAVVKLAVDLILIFLLRDQPAEILVVGLLASWVAFINLLHVQSRRTLRMNFGLDWMSTVFVGIAVVVVWTGYHPLLFAAVWLLLITWVISRTRSLLALAN
jgi:O-antigen/teichoic acid export membrane protein